MKRPLSSLSPQVEEKAVSFSYPQAAIEALVERGDLVEITGRERRRVYQAPRVFGAVYGSVDVADSD